MEYLKSGFKSVLGNQGGQNQPSASETVERLCDRVASSTLLEDRRDAVRALKSLSKKFRLEVGTQSMDLLITVLHTDRNDTEITGLALDALCNIMSADPSSQPAEDNTAKNGQTFSDAELGVQFTEIFIKKPENVTLLLGLLEEYEFHVRWPTVKLLTILLTNRSYQLQQCILVSPLGVSRLMDLLSDSREIIRNEGLLLLIQLTKSNAAIQKIVAFENAFDRLLEIIAEEGYSDGGIVVEDCLLLMQNLLKSNVSNQNFFREGSYIQRLTPFFELTPAAGTGDAGWLPQKIANIQLMLQLVRIMVSPDNPQQSTASCQKVMNQCGVLRQLCDILMASGIPADILTETINTVSEAIRGCQANQEYFAQVTAPSSPPRPAIVVLLMSMINEDQPLALRCAVLYCFQCYLYKNQQGQSNIVSTLLPSSADDVQSISAGQLLCAGLFSSNPLANWCAAVALSHCLKGNPTQKEQLLRVQLATSVGNPPVSLLQQCTNMLSQGGQIQTQVGLLLLLCSWLSDCAIAVAHLLHNANNVPYLTSHIEAHGEEAERLVGALCSLLLGIAFAYNDNSVEAFKKQDLRQLINKRIGVDNLLDKISYISKSEHFQRAVKSPEIKVESPEHVLFDHEFTKLFKKLEAAVTRAVEESSEEEVVSVNHVSGKTKQDVEDHESIVASYKELIREQDEELGRLKSKYSDLESSHNQAQAQLLQQAQEIQRVQEQAALSKTCQPPPEQSTVSLFDGSSQSSQAAPQGGTAALFSSSAPPENSAASLFTNTQSTASLFESDQSRQIAELNSRLTELHQSHKATEQKVQEKDEQIKKLKDDLEISQASLAVATAAATLGEQVTAGHDNESTGFTKEQYDELDRLRSTVASLQTQNSSLQKELDTYKSGVIPNSGEDYVNRIKNLEEKLSVKEHEIAVCVEQRDAINREHEDLLIMLEEQDSKLKLYKQRLRAAREDIVSDDEDEEEEEEEENDDEGNDENNDVKGTISEQLNGDKVEEKGGEKTEDSPRGVDEEKKLVEEEKADSDGFREDSHIFGHSDGKLELYNEFESDQDLETPNESQ